MNVSDAEGAWRAARNGLSTAVTWSLAVDATRAGTVYAGGSGGQVFVSTDRGARWRALPAPAVDTVWALALDAATDVLYAGTSGRGVFMRSER